ncbi:MAG TPA: hypothetical protein VIL42_10825 [Sphingomicrobium sp.]|jgi:P pilus assembly chaperone PapD
MPLKRISYQIAIALAMTAPPAGAAAQQLVLSSLIVELEPGKRDRHDVEVINRSAERAFVAVEPREIVAPGTADQRDRHERDPEKLGLLVAPDRIILEPGQRKLLRFAALTSDPVRERVFRVTVKPVAGQLQSAASGIKVLVGYDVLVLVRPSSAHVQLIGIRSGQKIDFRNDGNASLVLHHGKQCDPFGKCTALPGKRLYAGTTWTTTIDAAAAVEYQVDGPESSALQRF